MADPFATVDDLAALWRPLTAAERARADALLPAASAIIRAEVPDVDARLANESLDAELTKWVACQMVRRVMLSSSDMPPVSQQQQAVGGVSIGFTLVNPTGDLYMSRSELKMLGGRRQRASTISMIQGVP